MLFWRAISNTIAPKPWLFSFARGRKPRTKKMSRLRSCTVGYSPTKQHIYTHIVIYMYLYSIYVMYILGFWGQYTTIWPRNRGFFVRGRRPRTKNPRLRGHIVVYFPKKPNIYNIYSTFSGSQIRGLRAIYSYIALLAGHYIYSALLAGHYIIYCPRGRYIYIYIYCPVSRTINTVIALLGGIYTI